MAVPPKEPTAGLPPKPRGDLRGGRSLRAIPPVPPARPMPARAPTRPLGPPGASGPPLLSLVLWPALLTLGVTLLRLVGELRGWSTDYFSRLPGGALAIVGIWWLPLVVGPYFGWRLARAGVRSPHPVQIVGVPALALASGTLVGLLAGRLLNPSWTAYLVLWAFIALVAGGVAFAAWPAAGKPLLAYAAAARLPVVLVMALAIWRRWGTHYDAPPPGFPLIPPLSRWALTGLLPQATIWVAFTVAVGMAGSAVGVYLASRRRR